MINHGTRDNLVLPVHIPFPELSPEVDASAAPQADADARLRAMMAEHFDGVWRAALRSGLAEGEADDTAQRAFIVASRRLADIEVGRERSFLIGTAMRIAAETRRARARRNEVAEPVDDARRDPAPPADELVDRHRARALLDEIIESMPDAVRDVFVLFELEQLTMAEVAAALQIPPGTVASRLRRAREIFEHKIAVARAPRGARRGRAGGSP